MDLTKTIQFIGKHYNNDKIAYGLPVYEDLQDEVYNELDKFHKAGFNSFNLSFSADTIGEMYYIYHIPSHIGFNYFFIVRLETYTVDGSMNG